MLYNRPRQQTSRVHTQTLQLRCSRLRRAICVLLITLCELHTADSAPSQHSANKKHISLRGRANPLHIHLITLVVLTTAKSTLRQYSSSSSLPSLTLSAQLAEPPDPPGPSFMGNRETVMLCSMRKTCAGARNLECSTLGTLAGAETFPRSFLLSTWLPLLQSETISGKLPSKSKLLFPLRPHSDTCPTPLSLSWAPHGHTI